MVTGFRILPVLGYGGVSHCALGWCGAHCVAQAGLPLTAALPALEACVTTADFKVFLHREEEQTLFNVFIPLFMLLC